MRTSRWSSLEMGSVLSGPIREMTAARLRWYGNGLLTTSAGEPTEVGINIHTDDRYAQAEGLPEAIADGMLGANWVAEMLLDYFAEHYLSGSYLRVKFIKPIFLRSVLTTSGVVTAVDRDGSTTTYHMDVSIVDEQGTPRTVGQARVSVPVDGSGSRVG